MLKQNKAYTIILSMILPFSSIIFGIKNFENKFARNLLVVFGFGFLGFTALEEGDLERYATEYYNKSSLSLEEVISALLSVNTGKFYNEFLSVLFSFFDNHHFYFAFLYMVFGYFLVNTVFCFFIKPLRHCSNLEKLLLIGFALFFSIRNSLNLAFYTGAIYYLYMLVRYLIDGENKKFLLFTFLAPLFHIALVPLLLASMIILVFKKKSYLYFIPFILSLIVSQTSIINYIGSFVSSYDNQLLEGKYRSYVSEDGQERLNKRYDEGRESSNIKLAILNKSKEVLQYIILPFAMVLVWFKRKTFFQNQTVLLLFNGVLATWTISNLMMNVSQGERYLQIHNFLIFGILVVIYQKFKINNLFKINLFFLILFGLFYGLGSLYASNKFISLNFFVSNFFMEFFLN